MLYSKKDKEILCQLGQEYMEYANLAIQSKKVDLWKALNRCQMQRPMVTIDQVPWHEFKDESLVCKVEEPFWKGVELILRKKLFQWKNFPVDMILEPYFDIPAAVERSAYGVEIEEDIITLHEGETASSHHYKPIIREIEDVEKIKDITVHHDEEKSLQRMAEASEIFYGIGPVRLTFYTSFHLGVWDTLSRFIGIENIYFDLIDRPQFLHAAMRRITDATLAGINEANKLQVHNSNSNYCHCSYTYTDELLPGFNQGGKSISENCWAFGMAQLFSSTSPEVTAEFEIPYISQMAEKFGMVYYGCCERIDDRLEYVKKIPNLKKVSCSPWSDRNSFAEQIGQSLVMSCKPQPAFLAGDAMDENQVRQDLVDAIQCARRYNVNLEFLLKDVSTVRFDLRRLSRWSEIAIETMENI